MHLFFVDVARATALAFCFVLFYFVNCLIMMLSMAASFDGRLLIGRILTLALIAALSLSFRYLAFCLFL